MDVVPQRPPVDQEPEVHGLHAADGVDARDLHGGRADAEGAVARPVHQPLAHAERHRGWGRGGRTRGRRQRRRCLGRARRVGPAGVRLRAQRGGEHQQRDRGMSRANDGTRPPRLEQLAPRPDPRRPLHQVVAHGRGHSVEAAGMTREPGHELRARTPPVGEQQPRAVAPQRLPQYDQAQRHEARHRVAQPGESYQPRRPATRPPEGPRRSPPLLHLLGDDEVGPRLEPLHHVFHALGGVGEVGVQRDGAVALGPVGALQRETQQLLQAARVALPRPVRHDGHRQHLGVGRQHRRRLVGRGVVQHQQLILARKRREHLPHFPEHQPRCTGFVVNRHTDVDHGPAI